MTHVWMGLTVTLMKPQPNAEIIISVQNILYPNNYKEKIKWNNVPAAAEQKRRENGKTERLDLLNGFSKVWGGKGGRMLALDVLLSWFIIIVLKLKECLAGTQDNNLLPG